jgi:hypothetical protein
LFLKKVGFGDTGTFVGINQQSFIQSSKLWHPSFSWNSGWQGVALSTRFLQDLNNDLLPDIVCLIFFVMIFKNLFNN